MSTCGVPGKLLGTKGFLPTHQRGKGANAYIQHNHHEVLQQLGQSGTLGPVPRDTTIQDLESPWLYTWQDL